MLGTQGVRVFMLPFYEEEKERGFSAKAQCTHIQWLSFSKWKVFEPFKITLLIISMHTASCNYIKVKTEAKNLSFYLIMQWLGIMDSGNSTWPMINKP